MKPPSADLEAAIYRCLGEISTEEFELRWHQSGLEGSDSIPTDTTPQIKQAVSQYRETLQNGLKGLLGQISIPDNQAWQDAVQYARAVIKSPEDSHERAKSSWNRSCSELHRELLTRCGPATLEAARAGCSRIVSDHYGGDRSRVSHVDKKASFMRHCGDVTIGAAFYPASNPLALGCYDVGTVDCSLALAVWLPPKRRFSKRHLATCLSAMIMGNSRPLITRYVCAWLPWDSGRRMRLVGER
jgi:hypothetical protein